MATPRFYLNAREKTREKTIFLKFEHNSKKFVYFLSDKVSADDWNQKNQRVNGHTKEAIDINGRLTYVASMALKAYSSLIIYTADGNEVQPDIKAIQKQFLINIGQKKLSPEEKAAEKKKQEEIEWKKKEEDRKRKVTLPELFTSYIAAKALYSRGTHMIYERVRNNLISFSQKKNVSLLLDKLSMEFWDMYKNHLVESKEKGGLALVNETAKLELKKIKAVIRYYADDYEHMNTKCLKGDFWANEQQPQFNTYDEIEAFKKIDFKQAIISMLSIPETDDPERDNWTTKELASIMEVTHRQIYSLAKYTDIPIEVRGAGRSTFRFKKTDILNWLINREKFRPVLYSLERARDMYCFACYAPLRFEDFSLLTKDNVVNGYDDKGRMIKALRFRARKNKKLVQIPLNDYCLRIIEKYRNQAKDEKLFPVPSSQKLNKALHRALKLSGLFNYDAIITEFRGPDTIERKIPKWEILTFHCARHTFATNMIAMNIPISYVQEILGHKDQKTTHIYTHIIKEKLSSVVLEAINKQFKETVPVYA